MSETSQPLPPLNKHEIKSVLLVDDDAELAETLKIVLEAHNFTVAIQPDGVAALREVQAIDYDVILCDMLMPKMAGDVFYREVKQLKPELADRFIFVTGNAEEPKVESFLHSIDARVLFKPVLMVELVEMISQVLQQTGK